MIPLRQFIFTICALCCMSLMAVGQNHQGKDRFDKIENQKVAYITKQLNLTPSEAQRFFPLYNAYNKEIRAIKSEKSDISASRNSLRPSRDVIEFDAKEVELKKQYRTKFSQVIGSSRASQFFVIEQEFKDLLYKEWQSRQIK